MARKLEGNLLVGAGLGPNRNRELNGLKVEKVGGPLCALSALSMAKALSLSKNDFFGQGLLFDP